MNRLFPIVVIILAVALFFGYVRPTWDGEIANTRAEIDSLNNALDASARFSAKEVALETERNKLPPEQLARLDAFLPDSVDNIQLILDLNALASHSGVTLSNFTTSNVPNASNASSAGAGDAQNTNGAFTGATSPVDSLTIGINATGTYSAFRSFMTGVEQSLRPLDVTALTVTDSDTGVYMYQITLKFYWLH
jgi:Tfp pilus assembly protein PilO